MILSFRRIKKRKQKPSLKTEFKNALISPIERKKKKHFEKITKSINKNYAFGYNRFKGTNLHKSVINHLFYLFTENQLLVYHTHIGNNLKMNWLNPALISYILGTRDDMCIFNTASINLILRKALDCAFHMAKYRNHILINLDFRKFFRFTGFKNQYFMFVELWLPGLISNFKRTSIRLRRNYKLSFAILSRRQVKNMHFIKIGRRRRRIKKVYNHRYLRHPIIPKLSLGLVDNDVWLEECNTVGVSTVSTIDSASYPNKINYPIICNNKSVPFAAYLLSIFSEAYHQGKMSSYKWFMTMNPKLDNRLQRTITNIYNVKHPNYIEKNKNRIQQDKRKIKRKRKYIRL